MLNIIIIVVAVLLGGYLAFSRRLASSSSWQATVTPLASIMGSGSLGSEYPAKQRIATMRAAQILSAAIYLLFLALTTILFRKGRAPM